jgi:hypothetical protein
VTEKKKVLVEEFWSAFGVPKHFMFWDILQKVESQNFIKLPFSTMPLGLSKLQSFITI